MFAELSRIEFLEVYATVFGILVLCASYLLLRHLLLETARPAKKALLAAGMFVLYILMVLFLAVFFCTFALTMDQCFLAWTLAFMAGNVLVLFQAGMIWICRPKRRLSEEAKMKLKDI